MNKRKNSDEKIAKAIKRYLNGDYVKDIINDLKITPSHFYTILRKLRKNGAKIPERRIKTSKIPERRIKTSIDYKGIAQKFK